MQVSIDEIRLYPRQYIKAVLRHMGPEFWIVAIFPYYISWIWASGEVFPGYQWLADNPTQAGEYLATFAGWAEETGRFWLGLIVIGPLLGGGTVIYDDYFDQEIDSENPRKNSMPFQKVPARPIVIMGSATVLFLLSLFLAVLVSVQFFVCSVIVVVLSVVYSAPPIRLKARGGLDLATNMLGFGVLCSLAGYAAETSLVNYPWLWLIPMVLGTGSLYVLTTVADMEADERSDVRTVAVKLGFDNAVVASMGFLFLANVAILSLGLAEYLYTPGVVYRVWPISILEFVPPYLLLRGRRTGPILWVLFGQSSLMAFGTFLLALNHVGTWNV